MCKLLLVFLCILVSSTANASDLTLSSNLLYNSCKEIRKGENASVGLALSCFAYIDGFLDAYEMNWLYISAEKSYKPTFCFGYTIGVPPDVNNRPHTRAIIPNFLDYFERHPEIEGKHRSYALTKFLQETYPCTDLNK